jgi:ferritin
MTNKPLIDTELMNAIQGQIGHELYNSHIYLYVAGDLKNRGLDNIADIFIEQYKEEQGHAKIFFDLLTDLSIPVIIPSIESCEMLITSISDIAQLYLDREILTTESLDEIKHMAIDNSNPVVEERLRSMILIQQKEYEEATGFMDKSQLFKEWWQVGLWNEALK